MAGRDFRVIGWALIAASAALLASHLSVLIWFPGPKSEIADWFNMDRELNVPAFYSAGLLMVIATVLIDAGVQRRLAGAIIWRSWHFLGLCFVSLSVDEAFQFHENFNARTMHTLESLNLNFSFLYWAPWVLPYGVFAFLVALLSLRFLQSLDAITRRFVVLAGVIYLMGAVGMEVVGGWRVAALGGGFSDENLWNPTYLVVSTVEEILELSGASLMLFALVRYEQERLHGVLINVSPIAALATLLAGSLLADLVHDPLRSQIGAKPSLLLLFGCLLVLAALAIFANIKKRPIVAIADEPDDW
jgi:hypothetical protein